MVQLNFELGKKILYKNQPAIIIKIVDIDQLSIQLLGSNIIHTVKTSDLSPFNDSSATSQIPFSALTNEEWEKAKKRYEIIKPILDKEENAFEIKEIAVKNNIHFTTIYRWINLFNSTGQIASLSGQRKTGGKNKSRLNIEVDKIINEAILKIYLDSSKKSISKVIRYIKIRCKELDIEIPHDNTIRNRIKSLSEEEVLKLRYGKKAARDRFEPIKSSFPGANFPLAVVQVDHTCVDIILVDELYRKPFRRPYLTLAIDIFSRMVVGFNLSFDPPGEMGTGLCLANSILEKDNILQKYNVKGEWPCWGVMSTIHLDNAKEFRGNMLKKVCQNYGINIEHRPIATPHWGGHVERLLGTFSKEIHNLPGTTFSNIQDRENYDSVSNASLTITEFEKWLLIYIVNVYHVKIHSGIGVSPLEKYKRGILGLNGEIGSGLPPKLYDERRVRLDFMPYVERTIQEYGVIIEHIYYYDEVLRKYIHTREDNSKYSKKKKFIFKRDPRDISIIYFLDPELNEYFEVPYRDTSKPPISIWEFNEVVIRLQKQNIEINEDSIFNAYKEMDRIELKAINETKKLKRFSRLSDSRNRSPHEDKKNTKKIEKLDLDNMPEIKPFDDIEDDAFTF